MAELADEPSSGWLSLSELARVRGQDKGGLWRRVARLEAAGALTTRSGPRGTKLINANEFSAAVDTMTDKVREANGRRAAITQNGESASSSDPVLAREQARKTQIGADIAQLQLDELRGLLVRVADISAGAAIQGETLARRIDQLLPEWADDLAAVVAKDGTAGLRAALKGKARELRGALAGAFAAIAATPSGDGVNHLDEVEADSGRGDRQSEKAKSQPVTQLSELEAEAAP
jgi:hypothetical protein